MRPGNLTAESGSVSFLHGVLAVLFLASPWLLNVASAQWTVTDLHPTHENWDFSTGYGVRDDEQVGVVTRIKITEHASLWTGTAASWVDLHPAGWSDSYAYAVDNGQQVGQVSAFGTGGNDHASLWTGTAASWIDLHPSDDWRHSSANGVHNGQQVGNVVDATLNYRASLWTGTAASWVNLHPSDDWLGSDAHDVHDGQQVGVVWDDTSERASLWSSTADSWMNLHPEGEWSGSRALAVHNGQQAGEVWQIFDSTHASLWNGSADSWVDLHPGSATSSTANGVYNGRQVGYAVVDGIPRASFWQGTPESWVDLSLVLTDSWEATFAESIWNDATTIYVVGYGFTNDENAYHALLWTRPLVPEPGSALLLVLVAPLAAVVRRRNTRPTC